MNITSCPMLSFNSDAFLYECAEASKARSLSNGTFNSHTRFEPFLFDNYHEPKGKNISNFLIEMRKVFQHHFDIAPQYRKHEIINIETISFFSQSVATLFADVESMFKLFTSLTLPSFSQPTNTKNTYPTLSKIIDAYTKYQHDLQEDSPAFQAFEADNSVETKNLLATEFWSLFELLSNDLFNDYSPIFIGYAQWKFAPQQAAKPIDWKVRPPVGEEYFKYLKSVDPEFGKRPRRFGNNDGGGFKKDSPSHSHDKPQASSDSSSSRPHHDKKPPAAPATISADTPKFTEILHTEKPKPRTAPLGEHKTLSIITAKPRHHEKNTRPPDDSSEEQVDAAIAAAQQAIDELNSNPSLTEVGLKPTNSFLRRAQHAFIVESGFTTESRGESKHRCVFILQKK